MSDQREFLAEMSPDASPFPSASPVAFVASIQWHPLLPSPPNAMDLDLWCPDNTLVVLLHYQVLYYSMYWTNYLALLLSR